jgi:TolB-like protein/tetratricopeptide (TPR) repeat protein
VNGTSIERQDQSAWTKLRNRKVVQWGLVYVAGAWGFLQGLEYVSESFHWPEQLRQVALLALLIGLPIVLVLAWYHGDRGQQHVSGTELAVIGLLFVLGGGIFWRYDRASKSSNAVAVQADATMATTSAVADPRPSIAVLPFENRSRLEGDAFFVDGIHDDIVIQLSKVSALRVISRTSVERFRKTQLSAREIAQQLGVRSLLAGGVQRAGDRIRINVQLIDTGKDAQLWAETYDRDLNATNIFAIQTELATSITRALKTSLTPEEKARTKIVPTQDLEAWEAYQLGRRRMARRTSAGLAQAKQYFRKAIELDPGFALAHVGLADTAMMQNAYGAAALNATIEVMEQSVNRALQIDPDLAEAWVSFASLAELRGQYDSAEKFYRRAIELNPSYATAHQWFANVLVIQNRVDESLAHIQIAADLDPLSGAIQTAFGNALEGVGRLEEAELRYRKAIEVDPDTVVSYWSLGGLFALGRGRLDLAIPYYEEGYSLDPGRSSGLAILAEAYRALGDDEQASLWLERALKVGPDDPYVHAVAAMFAYEAENYAAGRAHAVKAAAEPYLMNPWRIDALRSGKLATARARYAEAFPELLDETPTVRSNNVSTAIDLALVLQRSGESQRAARLLDRSEEVIVSQMKRMGAGGYGISDVAIYALRGDKAGAIARLRDAQKSGWPVSYLRDFDPNFGAIRDDPEFRAVLAESESDMAQQRASLAGRPKDAPLE